MSIVVDASEVTALAGVLGAAAATIDAESAQSVGVAAEATEVRAQMLAPRRTGHLASTIHTEGDGTEREVVVDADYAIYVEFGTSTQAPQPFMFPAGDLGERVLEELSEEDVDPFGT